MTIESYLSELADMEKDLSTAELTQLSGLVGPEQSEVEVAWDLIPAARRQQIVDKLLEMTEDNVELDFYAVFCNALHDDEPAVRERALAGLWESDDRRTIPKLIERLENDNADEVRASAALGLGHFSELACTNKLLAQDGERVYQALLSALEDTDEPMEVRRRALEAVAPFQTTEVHDWITWGYKNADPVVQQSALHAMGRSCDASWLPAVYLEMDNEDPAIRYESANAAGELGEADAIPRLTELIDDTDPEVSMAATRAIGAIGGPQAKKVLRGLTAAGDDDMLKEAASDSLESMEDGEADFSMLELDDD